ncbi:MAG: hypothetical protein AB1512_16880 [Thermodesulfobacteriota bacterium]
MEFKLIYPRWPKLNRQTEFHLLLQYAWDTFYRDEPQEIKMFNLFQRVTRKEVADGTFRPRDRALAKRAFGRNV